jgi:hypothetical protein
MLGDGHCDETCFTAKCDFDFGDCTLPLLTDTVTKSFIVNSHNKKAALVYNGDDGARVLKGVDHSDHSDHSKRVLVGSSRPRGGASNSGSSKSDAKDELAEVGGFDGASSDLSGLEDTSMPVSGLLV